MDDQKIDVREIIKISLAVNLLFLVLIGSLIFAYRARIFGYFGAQYLNDVNQRIEKGENNINAPLTTDEQIMAAVNKANPAVVSIVISKNVPIMEQYYTNVNPFPDMPGFPSDLFGGQGFSFQVPQYRQKGTEKKDVGGGSGFIVSSDGLVITNNHVVSDKDASYTVFTNDGKKYDVTVLATDPAIDIAVLKIKGDNFPYIQFSDSDNVRLGQSVIAIGNALGEFRNSVSVGVVSGLSRSITAGDMTGKSESLDEVIQTDAAINPGNSGGPLLDLRGNVVGVNVAVVSGSENVGFSLPGNIARSVVNSVQKYGKIIRPYVGIRYMTVTESLKEKNKLSVDYGILVYHGESAQDLAVIPGSPADKAGIVENDIILEIDGVKLDSGKTFSSVIRKKNIGDTVSLKVLHNGAEKTVRITLEKFPEEVK